MVNRLDHILDWVFAAPSHVAVLRVLQDNKEGLSGRAVARMADVNHQACAVAIRNLEALGILHRQGSGHTQLIRLNTLNQIVRDILLPLLKKERGLTQTIHQDLIQEFKTDVKCMTVFGSAARLENEPESDFDVLFVVDGPRKSQLIETVGVYAHSFRMKFGIKLSALVLGSSDVRKRFKESDPLLKNIIQDGVDLLPQTLRGVVHWHQNQTGASPSRAKNTPIT